MQRAGQRTCSSWRVSVRRMSPAEASAMMPAAATSESVSVDLPWSTCAMTDIERMFRGLDWISCSWVRVKLTCAAGAARSEKGAPARARRADSCE